MSKSLTPIALWSSWNMVVLTNILEFSLTFVLGLELRECRLLRSLSPALTFAFFMNFLNCLVIYDFNLVSSSSDDSSLLMKGEFISRNGQMELPVSTNVSFKRVTGVVPATTPLMPKLEQKSNLPNGNE